MMISPIAISRRKVMLLLSDSALSMAEPFSPIARGNAGNDKVLAKIGAAYKKTAAQVCLRYLVQQDIVVIPRTSKIERLSENAAIFDFALSEAEMAEISALANPAGRLVDWAYSGRQKWD